MTNRKTTCLLPWILILLMVYSNIAMFTMQKHCSVFYSYQVYRSVVFSSCSISNSTGKTKNTVSHTTNHFEICFFIYHVFILCHVGKTLKKNHMTDRYWAVFPTTEATKLLEANIEVTLALALQTSQEWRCNHLC